MNKYFKYVILITIFLLSAIWCKAQTQAVKIAALETQMKWVVAQKKTDSLYFKKYRDSINLLNRLMLFDTAVFKVVRVNGIDVLTLKNNK